MCLTTHVGTIKKRAAFVRITKQGIRSRTSNIIILCLHDSSASGVEVGYTASKMIGNAVTRNLAKRRMRNIVFHLRDMFRNSYKYVIIARQSTPTCDFARLTDDVKWCINNIHNNYHKISSSKFS